MPRKFFSDTKEKLKTCKNLDKKESAARKELPIISLSLIRQSGYDENHQLGDNSKIIVDDSPPPQHDSALRFNKKQ